MVRGMKYCGVASKRVALTITIILSFSLTTATAEQDLEKCYTYSDYPSSYTGRLLLKQYPTKGETLKKGETPRDYWILEIPKSICTTDFPDYSLDKTEFNIKSFHLYMRYSQFEKYKKFLNKKVVVKAGISRANSTDDRTRVIMSVSAVELKRGSDKCFEYEPKVVKMRGHFTAEVFPNTLDRIPEKFGTYWIFHPEEPICAEKIRSAEFDLNSTEYNVTDIQLVPTSQSEYMYKVYRNLLDKKVVVKGTLYHSHTAHHKTKVLVSVIKISKIY